MTEKIEHARELYMSGGKTQKEIAQIVGVSDRTIYTWIRQFAWQKLRQAAFHAPAIIADNTYSQLAELQNAIAAREPGCRYPTMQEAEVIRKLVSCIDKLKKYPSLGQNMQMMENFKEFMRTKNKDFAKDLSLYAGCFLETRAKNGFAPFEMEYGVPQIADSSSFDVQEPEETGTSSELQNIEAKTAKNIPLAAPTTFGRPDFFVAAAKQQINR